MAVYFDDFLDEEEDEEDEECSILIDLKKIVDEMEDVQSIYRDEEDEEGDLSL